MATYELVPNAHILVYFVKKDILFSAKCKIDIKKELSNFIDVNLKPDTANPGQIVGIDIKSKPKSFIGLLGVDQSVLLLKSGNDLSNEEAFTELEAFTNRTQRRIQVPGEKSNQFPFYNNTWDDFMVTIF